MYKRERTCKCINDVIINDYRFHKGREYQVDVYPLYYQIYQNGGWDNYVFISSDEEFDEYFKLIE